MVLTTRWHRVHLVQGAEDLVMIVVIDASETWLTLVRRLLSYPHQSPLPQRLSASTAADVNDSGWPRAATERLK